MFGHKPLGDKAWNKCCAVSDAYGGWLCTASLLRAALDPGALCGLWAAFSICHLLEKAGPESCVRPLSGLRAVWLLWGCTRASPQGGTSIASLLQLKSSVWCSVAVPSSAFLQNL